MSGGPEARGVPPHCPPAPSYGNTSAAPGGTRRSKRGGNGAEAIGARDRHARAPSPPRASPQHLRSSLAAAPSPAPCLNTRAKEFGGGAGEDARAPLGLGGGLGGGGVRVAIAGHRCSHVIMARELTPSPALPVLVSRLYLDSPTLLVPVPLHTSLVLWRLLPLRPCGASQMHKARAALRRARVFCRHQGCCCGKKSITRSGRPPLHTTLAQKPAHRPQPWGLRRYAQAAD